MNSRPVLVRPHIRTGFGLLALVLLIGTVGYTLIEGWPLIESFYTSVLVVSTLGFSDEKPSDTPGKLLTTLLIGGGVGTLYYLVGAIAQNMIEEQFNRSRRRSMEQHITRLKDHFIVCGFGRVGRHTCRQLAQEHHPFVVIDNDDRRIQSIADAGYLYLQGDASDDAVLKRAGVERARALLTAVQSDAGNVYITLSAHAINPRLFIVARAATAEAEHKLTIAGANRVISPYILGGRSMAAHALRPSVMDFLDVLVHSDDMDMWLEELVITPGSPLDGVQLGSADLRGTVGVTVLAVRIANGQMCVNPRADVVLHAGDTLIVLGSRADLERIEADG